MKNTSQDLKSIVEGIMPDLVKYLDSSMSGEGKVLTQELASELSSQLCLEDWIKLGGNK